MKLQALAWQTNRHSFDEKQKTASPHALKKYENLESYRTKLKMDSYIVEWIVRIIVQLLCISIVK